MHPASLFHGRILPAQTAGNDNQQNEQNQNRCRAGPYAAYTTTAESYTHRKQLLSGGTTVLYDRIASLNWTFIPH